MLFLLTGRSPADLPQKRMKVDFRSLVQISPHFADWLEKMLEPTVEDRFQTASAAMKALRNENLSNLVFVKKPAGSRIVLRKSHRNLVVEIPPAGLRVETLFLAVFALFWNGFVFFWTALAIGTGAPLFFPLFSIPFWLVGLGMLGGLLFAIAGSTTLKINWNSFCLQVFVHDCDREVENIYTDYFLHDENLITQVH
ncbi:MAG: hypothetical protein AB4426_35505 [Xenococcaceae cyanobacterium]